MPSIFAKIKKSMSPKRKRSTIDTSTDNNNNPNEQLTSNSPQKVQQAFQQRKQFATEGNLNFRLLAFAGGLAVIFTSIESLDLCFYRGDLLKSFIYLYTLSFGFVICLLEGQFIRFEFVQNARQRIVGFVPALKYLWGRGVFYIVSGILQSSEMSPANILSGLFLVGVGVLFVIIGWSTKRRLSKFKKCLKDPKCLKKYFRKYDRDGDNVLDKDEFGALIVGLTAEEMDEDELEGAFAVMDTQGKGYVTLDELIAWWQGFEVNSKEEETGGYDLL